LKTWVLSMNLRNASSNENKNLLLQWCSTSSETGRWNVTEVQAGSNCNVWLSSNILCAVLFYIDYFGLH
jgi:hypothetical protein